MTTPTYSSGKYGQPFYTHCQGFYGMPTQNPMNPYANAPFATFSNQLPYRYVLPQGPYFTPYPNYPYALNFSPGTHAASERPQIPISHQVDGTLKPKNQSKPKQASPQIVDLVSDEEEPIQTKKASYDKTSASNSRLNEYNQTELQTVTINQPLNEKKPETSKTIAPKPSRQKQVIKPSKKQEPQKHKLLKKTTKNVTESSSSHIIDKSKIHSKRLSQKQTSKKEPFRLPKRQRQMLQIGFLREFESGILIGPQFQAKIPSFKKQLKNDENWLNEIRENLLIRKYEEESESDDE